MYTLNFQVLSLFIEWIYIPMKPRVFSYKISGIGEILRRMSHKFYFNKKFKSSKKNVKINKQKISTENFFSSFNVASYMFWKIRIQGQLSTVYLLIN